MFCSYPKLFSPLTIERILLGGLLCSKTPRDPLVVWPGHQNHVAVQSIREGVIRPPPDLTIYNQILYYSVGVAWFPPTHINHLQIPLDVYKPKRPRNLFNAIFLAQWKIHHQTILQQTEESGAEFLRAWETTSSSLPEFR